MFRLLTTVALLGLATLGAQAAPLKPVVATDVQCTDCVGASDIASNAVGPTEIVNGSVSDAKLNQAVRDRIAALETSVAALASQQAEIDALKARPGPVMVAANGSPIGPFLPIEQANPDQGRYQTLSAKNYLFGVNYKDDWGAGRISTESYGYGNAVYFESNDCSGQGYVQNRATPQGEVFRIDRDDRFLYYIAESNVPVLLQNMLSTRTSDNDCLPSGIAGYFRGEPVFLNDPDVTGVPNSDFPAPITLVR